MQAGMKILFFEQSVEVSFMTPLPFAVRSRIRPKPVSVGLR